MIGVYTFDDIDRGALTVEIDWDHAEAEEVCREINDFWSGSQDRLDDCPENEDDTNECDRLGWAMSKLILGELIDAAGRKRVETTTEAKRHFDSPNLEGFPKLDGEHGVTIIRWAWYPTDVDDFHGDWARIEKAKK